MSVERKSISLTRKSEKEKARVRRYENDDVGQHEKQRYIPNGVEGYLNSRKDKKAII
tara:strand:- start:927 stop:1097 length:171 start_codon:yes stop_codon:yes gene_type:complete